MNESRTSLEIIAPSIEEAIAKGLEDLGLTEEEVEVEVLDPGSRGLFGLGTRQARVRLKIRSEGDSDLEPDLLIVGETVEEEEFEEIDLEVEFAALEQSYGRELAGEEGLEAEIAQAVVEDLLTKMHVRASVSARMGEKDEERGQSSLVREHQWQRSIDSNRPSRGDAGRAPIYHRLDFSQGTGTFGARSARRTRIPGRGASSSCASLPGAWPTRR